MAKFTATVRLYGEDSLLFISSPIMTFDNKYSLVSKLNYWLSPVAFNGIGIRKPTRLNIMVRDSKNKLIAWKHLVK